MSNPAEGDMEDIRSAKSTGIGSPKAMGDKDGDTFPTEEPGVFTELVESTDFPNFVADLIKAVFDANLKVMKEQTDAYIQLMKEATESMVDFIKKVNEEAAFLKLAESKGDKYGITIEQTADSCQKLVLTTPDGDPADLQNPEVQRDVVEAKIVLAKERRSALREFLLMGVNRIVVVKGEIKAVVEFSPRSTARDDEP